MFVLKSSCGENPVFNVVYVYVVFLICYKTHHVNTIAKYFLFKRALSLR